MTMSSMARGRATQNTEARSSQRKDRVFFTGSLLSLLISPFGVSKRRQAPCFGRANIGNALENRYLPIFKQGGAGAPVPLGSKQVTALTIDKRGPRWQAPMQMAQQSCGKHGVWPVERSRMYAPPSRGLMPFGIRSCRQSACTGSRIAGPAGDRPGRWRCPHPCRAPGFPPGLQCQ